MKRDFKDNFVPIEIAKLAKEHKFNYGCIAWYDPKTSKLNMLGQEHPDHIHTTFFTIEIIQAPLYQQLVEWFEKEHKLLIETRWHCMEGPMPLGYNWLFEIDYYGDNWNGEYNGEGDVLLDGYLNQRHALYAAFIAAFRLIKTKEV